jgi:HEAT repeat protein
VLVASAARLFALGALWRGAGVESAGRALVSALGISDENLRTIAGMMLVKAGPRSAPLLKDALARRQSVPMALAVLGDLGDPSCESALRAFTSDPDPKVAAAAREALRALEASAGANRRTTS